MCVALLFMECPTRRYTVLSPYRCNDCQIFFRVVSKEFQMGVAVLLSVVVASVVVLLLFGVMSGMASDGARHLFSIGK